MGAGMPQHAARQALSRSGPVMAHPNSGPTPRSPRSLPGESLVSLRLSDVRLAFQRNSSETTRATLPAATRPPKT